MNQYFPSTILQYYFKKFSFLEIIFLSDIETVNPNFLLTFRNFLPIIHKFPFNHFKQCIITPVNYIFDQSTHSFKNPIPIMNHEPFENKFNHLLIIKNFKLINLALEDQFHSINYYKFIHDEITNDLPSTYLYIPIQQGYNPFSPIQTQNL